MIWIWDTPKEYSEFRADFYGFEPQPDFKHLSSLARTPLPKGTRAIFKSRFSLKRFKTFHNPPTTIPMVIVDSLWRKIISQFVSTERVQFVPAVLTAQSKVSEDYYAMLVFDRVIGIDKHRSLISLMDDNENGTHIYSIQKVVLVPDCLGHLHLARDKQSGTMLYVSDELRNALSETGQDSPFYTVDEYNARHLS